MKKPAMPKMAEKPTAPPKMKMPAKPMAKPGKHPPKRGK